MQREGNEQSASAMAERSARDLMQAALAHHRAGRMAEAEAMYRDIARKAPGSADARHNLAILLQQQGRLDAAVASYRAALSITPRSADLHYNLASALGGLQRTDEAIASYRDALSIAPRHVLALVNLGNALGARGDLDDAAASYRKALELEPAHGHAHYNLGVVRHQQGRLAEAVASYRRALALGARAAEAHYNLGNALLDLGNAEEGIASLRDALSTRPDFAEAHNNLGRALQRLGNPEAAVDCYRKALATAPDDAGTHNNLGTALEEMGEVRAALASYRRSLALNETRDVKSNLARCVMRLVPDSPDAGLRVLLDRAMREAWTRPADLAPVSIAMTKLQPDIAACIGRVNCAWAQGGDSSLSLDDIAVLASDDLLRTILQTAQVCDVELERTLTVARSTLLDAATLAIDRAGVDGSTLEFACALARQCFINEYVFGLADEELRRAFALRDRLAAAAHAKAPYPAELLPIVAAYFPLSSLPDAARWSDRQSPGCLQTLIVQQVGEPLEERQQRARIVAVTAIDDTVSIAVREQYEEHPYPRWIALPPAGNARPLHAFLREQFPFAPLVRLPAGRSPEILVAGCGTGQETLETARSFTGASVLAIDLSLSSLAYAARKAGEAGVTNVTFAHGDLLQVGGIGRTFDAISAVGVLHHLADPAAGLRELLAVLRPGGVMRLGLYSELARRHVVAARDYIAQRAYPADAAGIRLCRQDLIDEGARFAPLAALRDFYVTSECRDLLFHVQEHRFTLPQIGTMLAESGLRLLGFLHEPQVLHAYRRQFPDDAGATNLKHWHVFETRFPDTFAGMYRFWVQKPAVELP